MAMTGETRDAGFEIGVSRTLPYPIGMVWQFLTGPNGLDRWLGPGAVLTPKTGAPFRTNAGLTGEVRGYRELDRIRLTWRPDSWDHDTTVQVAVRANGERTVLRFHQEQLSGPAERERQRSHWQDVMAEVIQALDEQVRDRP